MTRLYKKGSIDSSESEEDPDETDNSNFEETLYKSVAEAVAESKVLLVDYILIQPMLQPFAALTQTRLNKCTTNTFG